MSLWCLFFYLGPLSLTHNTAQATVQAGIVSLKCNFWSILSRACLRDRVWREVWGPQIWGPGPHLLTAFFSPSGAERKCNINGEDACVSPPHLPMSLWASPCSHMIGTNSQPHPWPGPTDGQGGGIPHVGAKKSVMDPWMQVVFFIYDQHGGFAWFLLVLVSQTAS